MPNAIHQQLRAATREQHEQLHGLMELDLLLFSRQTYATALSAYLRAISPLEHALSQLCRTLQDRSPSMLLPPDVEQRIAKAQWIRSDLVVVGSALHPRDVELDHDVNLDESLCPDLSSLAAATATLAGFSYVMEGMTLGATRMLPRVTKALGYTADSGATFFGAYGLRTLEMWQRFTNWLDTINVSDEQVVQAAQDCFRRFEHELDRWNRSATDMLRDSSSHA